MSTPPSRPTGPRVVVDTGVFWRGIVRVSAGDTLNGKFVRAGLFENRYTLLYSAEILQEYLETPIKHPKMAHRLHITEERLALVARLVVQGGRVVHVHSPIRACRDPGDDKFLACAVDGQGDLIVSADQDLLELTGFRNIPILPVPMAWSWLEQQEKHG